jgi:hypothetical protein
MGGAMLLVQAAGSMDSAVFWQAAGRQLAGSWQAAGRALTMKVMLQAPVASALLPGQSSDEGSVIRIQAHALAKRFQGFPRRDAL